MVCCSRHHGQTTGQNFQFFKITLTLKKSYKILQKLSPKHAACGVVQSPYPIYRHGKASLSEQPPWRAAGDPRLARGRSRVRAPGPGGRAACNFFSTLPSFLLREIFFRTFPTQPAGTLGLRIKLSLPYLSPAWKIHSTE